jgi:signal peptidase I
MNFFEKRQYRKMVKQVMHEIRHTRHMREDITEPEKMSALDEARSELQQAWRNGDKEATDKAIEQAGVMVGDIYPSRSVPRFRENLEILVVALAVAMAFRTYFIQPFKIPTGSMQPTLYGITFQGPSENELLDKPPFQYLNYLIFGRAPKTIRALADGKIRYLGKQKVGGELVLGPDKKGRARIKTYDTVYTADFYAIGNMSFPIPENFKCLFENGQAVTKGQVLAKGVSQAGDHIFVNKVLYNFIRPERGDIIVFDTANIDHPQIRKDTFYIKRLAGMPGDSISINPPYLIANGETVTEPYPFKRLVTEHDAGYVGYDLAGSNDAKEPVLNDEDDVLVLDDNHFLPLGDNTRSSLDGRYFGGVEKTDLVGPAFCVYWPVSKRWGRVQ